MEIYGTKKKVAKILGIGRTRLDRLIKNGFVKKVYNNGKNVGYLICNQ